jgi:hypothetical protein
MSVERTNWTDYAQQTFIMSGHLEVTLSDWKYEADSKSFNIASNYDDAT